jgi:glycosyltransferase 2 family protein
MRLLRHGFMAAVVVALAFFLWRQRADVAEALASISPGLVLLSLVLALGGSALPGLAWRDLLASQGYGTGRVGGLRVFYIAQLGKYLPGGIWSLVAQVGMARDLKVPGRQAATATFLVLALSLISAMLVAGVVLPLAIPGLLDEYWWVFLAVPVLVVLLLPPVVAWWSALAFRLLRRPVEPVQLSWGMLVRLAAMLVVSWVLLGLSFGALVQGLGADVADPWLLSVGLFPLAWVAGFLVIIAPAGAGVREGALVLGFSGALDGGAVLTVALLSRVLLVLADVVLAAALVLAVRLRARPVGR